MTLVARGYKIHRMKKLFSFSDRKIYSFFDKLQSLGVGEFYKSKIFIDNIYYNMSPNLVFEKGSEIKVNTLIVEINNTCTLKCMAHPTLLWVKMKDSKAPRARIKLAQLTINEAKRNNINKIQNITHQLFFKNLHPRALCCLTKSYNYPGLPIKKPEEPNV